STSPLSRTSIVSSTAPASSSPPILLVTTAPPPRSTSTTCGARQPGRSSTGAEPRASYGLSGVIARQSLVFRSAAAPPLRHRQLKGRMTTATDDRPAAAGETTFERNVARLRTWAPVLVLIVIGLAISLVNPNFLQASNFIRL